MENKEVLIDGEKVYLRKDLLGWRIVHPWKVDGKISWVNMISGGNWYKTAITAFMVFIIIMAMLEFRDLYVAANNCINSVPLLMP